MKQFLEIQINHNKNKSNFRESASVLNFKCKNDVFILHETATNDWLGKLTGTVRKE